MAAIHIRDAQPRDAPAVLDLNLAEVQWTSPVDFALLEQLSGKAGYYRVAEVDGEVVGFVLAMSEGCNYENDNFKWFSQRCSGFMYIDRVVVAERHAGRGLGSVLYSDVFSAVHDTGHSCIVCEYTQVPENVASRAFHAKMGFVEIGRRTVAGSNKVLSMQRRALPDQRK